ncbi:sce7726 family protein [Aeromicrobium sp. JJY06]|uniref:sce7726 family protein n=1 Tax=Aeromicrobium sp. JJY06 TaxID=3373478 RepID=UPI00376F40AC
MKQRPEARAAAALLSSAVIRSVISDSEPHAKADAAVARLNRFGMTAGVTSMRSLVWRCDRYLRQHYRSDHVYRTAVLRDVSGQGSVVLPEFRAGESLADMLCVSDVAHAIEIKSELDGIGRLRKQLDDYRLIAPRVTVVGSRRLIDRISDDPELRMVGLATLTDPGDGLVHLRVARDDPTRLDPVTMFRSLRRAEYLSALSNIGVTIPALPNTAVFSFAKQAVSTVDSARFNREFVRALSTRAPKLTVRTFGRAPLPLRPALLRLNPSGEQVRRLHTWLETEIPHVHA